MAIVVLCGLASVGKTTIGAMVAKKKGVPFWDLDHLLQAIHGKNIATLYDRVGKSKFRSLESSVLKSLDNQASAILSIGGGTLEKKSSFQWVEEQIVVYLAINPETLQKRSGFRCPKPLQGLDFVQEAKKRMATFEKVCHFRIETDDKTEHEVAEEVWQVIR